MCTLSVGTFGTFMDRRTSLPVSASSVTIGFEWEAFVSSLQVLPEGRRIYYDTWFLSVGLSHRCIRSRRFQLHASLTPQDLKSACIELWQDLLLPGRPVQLFEVKPKPDTLLSSKGHLIVVQGDTTDHASVLVKCDALPVLAKHRAVLIQRGDCVLDVLATAQIDLACEAPLRACTLETLGDVPQSFVNDEQPWYRQGALVQAHLHFMHPAPADAESSEDDSTCVPSPKSIDSVADLDSTGSLTSDDLPWSEIPLDYRIQDVFELSEDPSWIQQLELSQEPSPGDLVSFMQRDRSRSRDESGHSDEDEAPESDEPNSPSTQNSSESPDTFDWEIYYTHMPTDPAIVRAGPEGPSIAAAAHATGFPAPSVVGIYPIRTLAQSNTEFVAVMECREDHVAHGSEALIMFDVICRDREAEVTEGSPGDYGPHLFHSAHISRAWLSFSHVVAIFHLSHMMESHAQHLTVLHNGNVWDPADPLLHHMQNGDHLEVIFGDSTDLHYRRDLIVWLRAEGLSLWPALVAAAAELDISPTMPFVAQAPAASSSCSMGSGSSPALTFRTWYVSHRNFPSCTDPRVIRFTGGPQEWRSVLAQVWEDRFDQHASFTITWVTPQPHTNRADPLDLSPHLIIEQHQRSQLIAVHLTALVGSGDAQTQSRGAFSVATLCPTATYLDLMGLDRLCARRYTCRITHDHLPIRDTELIRRPTGQAITIHAFEHESGPESDQQALMQWPHALPLTLSPFHRAPADTGSMDDLEPFPMPVLPLQSGSGEPIAHEAQPSDQASRDACIHQAAACGAPSEEVSLSTYFLSPRAMSICAFPRIARISTGTTWREEILRLWKDHYDPHAPVEILTVHPAPPNSYVTDTPMLFALVVQHRSEQICPILVTIEEQSEFIHIAWLAPTQATPRQLIEGVGQGNQCFGPRRASSCEVRIGAAILQMGSVYSLRPGVNVLLQLLPLTSADAGVHLEVMAHSDQVSLLQRPQSDRRNEILLPIPAEEDSLCPSWTRFTGCQSYTEDNPNLRSGLAAKKPSQQPTPIDLVRALPVRSTAVDFGPVLDLHAQLADVPLPVQYSWPHGFLTQHDQLQDVFHIPFWQHETPLAYSFYTDASFRGTAAVGIGVILLVHTEQGDRIGGHICQAHFGASAFPGEQLALGWAMLWAFQLQLWHEVIAPGYPLHISFYFDAQAVGYMAAGWMASHGSDALSCFLRDMGICLEEFWQPSWIHWYHVHGHSGHFWNEVVDKLAGQGLRGDSIDCPWWAHHVAQLEDRSAVAWLWAVRPLAVGDSTLPKLQGRWLMHCARLPQLPLRSRLPAWDVSPSPSVSQPPRVGTIRVVSANVLTLSERQDRGLSITGARQLAIMTQIAQHQPHIVGVQETRHKARLSQNNSFFHVLGHAATPQGTDGVQLWLAKDRLLREGGTPLQLQHVSSWIAATPAAVPRKRHLHPSTWNLIQYKKNLYLQKKRLRQLERSQTLRACFEGWRDGHSATMAEHRRAVSRLHRATYDALDSLGFAFGDSDAPAPTVAAPLEQHPCAFCDRIFATKQQLAAHEYQQHDQPSIEFQYVQSPVCPGCLRNFWTSRRLQQHLRYRRNRCFDRVHGTREPVEGVSIVLSEEHKHIKRLQVFRDMHGPLRPTPTQRATAILRGRVWWLLQRFPFLRYGEHGRDPGAFEQIYADLGRLGADYGQQGSEVDFHSACLALLEQRFDDSDAALWCLVTWLASGPSLTTDVRASACALVDDLAIQAPFDEYQQLQADLENVDPEPIFPVLGRRAAQGYADRRYPLVCAFSHMAVEEASRRTWKLRYHSVSPRDLAMSHRLVIHLFSGRRRAGDFQHFAEIMLKGIGGYMVISFDTAVDASMNIFQPQTWDFLWRAAQGGHIYALLLGPPCESWSEVRYMALQDAQGFVRRGPRPLRSFDYLWGLSWLSLREYSQLHLGNQLLLRGLWLGVLTRGHGGRVIVEHPHMPDDPGRPSIWRSALVQHLCGTGLFHIHSILQYKYGAAGVKPTMLLCGGVSTSRLDAWGREDFCRPQVPLVGTDGSGRFRTFAAKEYPFLLNAAFAHSMLYDAQYALDSTAADPEWTLLAKEFCAAAQHSHGAAATPSGTWAAESWAQLPKEGEMEPVAML
eukprot:Skav235615  [mRNA]  locus=scaffold358:94800:107242:+ [translate_table: standard]